MNLQSIFNSSFSLIETINVAIQQVSPSQQHLGFLYNDSEDKTTFLHLAWHYKLKKDNPNKELLWLEPYLSKEEQTHLATICELVYTNNKNGIPYGLSIDSTGFAPDGKFISDSPYAGLTCATFVLQVLHSQGFVIIDFSDWKYRKDDKEWQTCILATLEQHGAKKEHINYQYQKILKDEARFRPEEVAAASTLPNPPHGIDHLQPYAQKILASLKNHKNKLQHS